MGLVANGNLLETYCYMQVLHICHSVLVTMLCTFVFVGAKKSGKQSLLNFKPVATKPKKSESLDEELDDDSDSAEVAVVPRERVERKAKGEYRGGCHGSEPVAAKLKYLTQWLEQEQMDGGFWVSFCCLFPKQP